MIKKFKKLVLASAIVFSSMSVVPQSAQAGIFLFPAGGLGLYFIIMGAVYDRPGLIILKNDKNEQMKNFIAEKYPTLDDVDVIEELALAINSKVESTDANEKGEIKVQLSKEEVEDILAPSGLLDLDPELSQKIIEDLK